MTSSPTRHAALSAAALVAAFVLAACSGGDGVRVADPAPTGAAAQQCAALRAALPTSLLGRKIRDTTPKSSNTAAWGDPAITLRCGVPKPAGATDQDADSEENSGVCWLVEPLQDGSFRFTAVKQRTYVEVDVPAAYAGAQSPLGALAGPVLRADPTDAAKHPFDCV